MENTLISAAFEASQANEEEKKSEVIVMQPETEEEKFPHLEVQPQVVNDRELFRRYSTGN